MQIKRTILPALLSCATPYPCADSNECMTHGTCGKGHTHFQGCQISCEHLTLEHPHLPLGCHSMASFISTPQSAPLLPFMASLSWPSGAGCTWGGRRGSPSVGWSVEGRARSRLREIPGHHYVVIQSPFLITRQGSESLGGLRPQPCRCKLPAKRVNSRCISNQRLSARLNLTSKL